MLILILLIFITRVHLTIQESAVFTKIQKDTLSMASKRKPNPLHLDALSMVPQGLWADKNPLIYAQATPHSIKYRWGNIDIMPTWYNLFMARLSAPTFSVSVPHRMWQRSPIETGSAVHNRKQLASCVADWANASMYALSEANNYRDRI